MGVVHLGAQGCLLLVAGAIALRQADRWWFSPRRAARQRALDRRDLMDLQRRRANDLTPVLLMAGHGAEIAGWWMLAAAAGPAGWTAAALAVAVKFRHLQEVSHFAVHGVLTRSPRLGILLAEACVHLPLGLGPVADRRRRHVREHHPNATVAGADPNLADLEQAGLLPGATRARYAAGIVFPLTPAGLAATCRSIAGNVRPATHGWARTAALAACLAAALALGGWPAALFGLAVPRLLLYPQLAWLSLIVEHRWFDAAPPAGPGTVALEAGRCLRLYPASPVMALLARGTWLPYGDLFHFAHSAHPAVRWNYLPVLERVLGMPEFAPTGLLVGAEAVVARHWRALGRRRGEGAGNDGPAKELVAAGPGEPQL
ncbi:fatty acid desaturase [Kitasatospora phosalacinea]|uniref:fatty acid desaturase n=1 Tax=Kitasatospora phosalacinea TaxID=2065 RepID=UPI003669943A